MEKVVKRTLDIIVSLAALSLLAPLLLVIAIAVRVHSPGPAIYRQQRLGRHGAVFSICKFRSMQRNAPDLRNPDGSAFTGISDPRVTPLGAWLRSSSLDELPQLWNVLKGEMSIVGPRPDQAGQLLYYSTADRVKLAMRPGITGLAQVSGRNSIAWQKRREMDCHYVAHWSLLLDCKILLKTIPCVFLKRDIHEVPNHDGHTTSGSTR